MKKLKMEYLEYCKCFRPEKRNKRIEDIIRRNIRNLFENEKTEIYYKPVRVSIFSSKKYIEYEGNCGRNKTLSVGEYLNKLDHI